MAHLQGCCCCFSLRTGSLIIGTVGWIATLLKIFNFAGMVGNQPPENKYGNGIEVSFCIKIGYAILSFICCVLLVIGVYKNNAKYFIPWLIATFLEGIVLILFTGFCFVLTFTSQSETTKELGFLIVVFLFAILLFFTALTWYFWTVIYSYYHKVESEPVEEQTVSDGKHNIYYIPTSYNQPPPVYEKNNKELS